MVSHRITFGEEDLEFIKAYKEAYGVSIQEFVRVAVGEKIAKIKLEEELKDLSRLKK